MKHQWKLGVTLLVGVMALILEFIFHSPISARVLITIVGILMATSLVIEMVKTIKSGKYGVDILAIMAIIATMIVGEYWASLMILIMLTGGDSLEDYAASQAGKELESLLKNAPQSAHLLTADSKLKEVSADDLNVGDLVVVKPGELVPVDGVITQGSSTFDESSLTGESTPVSKTQNQKLMSGSINGDSSVTMKVEKVASESQYQAIVHLVKSSEAKPAKFVKMADRYAVPFTIIALVIAGVAWAVSKDPVRFAEVLVVASPCPLILAAPVSLVAGMSRMSRNHIVVKSGTAIEKIALTKTVAFDKTGTLTKNQLKLNDVQLYTDINEAEFLKIAASVEQNSSHILARSLLNEVNHDKLYPVSNLKEVTGNGVIATVNNQEVKVGKLDFVSLNHPDLSLTETAIHISIAGQYAGYLTFSDQIRPEAKQTIADLKALGVENIMMLTGDDRLVANKVAQELGIDQVKAECLPIDKINYLKAVKDDHRPVMMVGDGVNDAPSLSASDVGIAMGATGATAASESADAVILVDDLAHVSRAVKIARRTMNVARTDVITGIVILIMLMLVASFGLIPALFGAILQEVVDTITIVLGLLAKLPPRGEKY